MIPTIVTSCGPASVSSVTLSPTARSCFFARPLSTAISPAAAGAAPSSTSTGLRSSSSIQRRPVAPSANTLPSAPRNATEPVRTPAVASTPSVAAIASAAGPAILQLAREVRGGALVVHDHRGVDARVLAVDVALEGVEHAIGEEPGCGEERNARDDRDERRDVPGGVVPDAEPGEVEHWPRPRTASCGRGPCPSSDRPSSRRSGRRRGTGPRSRTTRRADRASPSRSSVRSRPPPAA